MKVLSRVSATISMVALSMLCALLSGCGAGSIPSLAEGSVSNTQNPLVAAYTVRAGCPGKIMVEFGPTTSYGRNTAWYTVDPSSDITSVLVAGMTASTTYHMRAQVQCSNGTTSTTPDKTFTTGPLPSLNFPTLKVTRPSPSTTSPENPGIEMIDVDAGNYPAFFTDRNGNVIWYYSVHNAALSTMKILPNGHIIMSWETETDFFLQEADLQGAPVRSLHILDLQHQMANTGRYDFIPFAFTHDVLPLPNGHLLALLITVKSFTNLAGYPGTMNVEGNAIVDLDENWNVTWAWNSFDYNGNGLDINRHLNGLPDWTHANALVYLPEDGNILISLRHQSWILKLDYENGTGDGHIIWHLGYQGDLYGAGFALTLGGVPTDDPINWFSFQHFPSLISQNGPLMTLAIWDNGNDRVQDPVNDTNICLIGGLYGAPFCYSRATVFQVDESSMVANLVWTDPQSAFGEWGGSINQLDNGNIEFDLNDPEFPPSPSVGSYVQEVTQTASPQILWQMELNPTGATAYRAYRVPSLYPGVTWQF